MDEMPKYRCHKEVYAVKIKDVRENILSFFEDGWTSIDVGQEYVNKHNPHSGGYYVVYEDGYASFSPAEAFEAGYTRL